MDPVSAAVALATERATRKARGFVVKTAIALVPVIGGVAIILAVAAAMSVSSVGSAGSQTLSMGPQGCTPVDTTGAARPNAALAAQVAYAAGFRGGDLVVAVAIAGAESAWNPRATNDNRNGSIDRGLWQINSIHAALISAGDPFDPAYNAYMAHEIWSDAGGFRPWVTFNTGSYRQFLDDAAAAVGDAPDGGCTPSGDLVDPGDGPQGPDGLRPRAAYGKALTLDTWGCDVRPKPCISTVGGYSYRVIAGTGTLSDHATGRANDIMIPNYKTVQSRSLGTEIAEFFVINASALGVKYIIYHDEIWNPREGWRAYCHPAGCRGGDTLQHRDHVHVSYLGG